MLPVWREEEPNRHRPVAARVRRYLNLSTECAVVLLLWTHVLAAWGWVYVGWEEESAFCMLFYILSAEA